MRLFILLLSIPLAIVPLQAEIITDGSTSITGQTQHLVLSNGEYQVTQDLGTTAGQNLYHSFQDFNLAPGETASFSGEASIQNVFARVTGGQASTIYGTVRNTVPGANTYLLNPAGIVFGPGAQLDVQGSFYASTANYLDFGNQRFSVSALESSQFSIAAPSRFGFLGSSSIQIKNSSLSVLPTKTLSLSAGHIELLNTQPPSYDAMSTPSFSHQLTAPSGNIHLQAANTINMNNFGVDTSGLFGGMIDIQAQQLNLHDSQISSHTVGAMNGQSINIQVDNLQLTDSDIVANTYGAGHGADIHLQVKETLAATRDDRPLGIEFNANANGSSHIRTMTAGQTEDMGDSGDIHIQAKNINLSQAAEIRTRSYSSGMAGNVSLEIEQNFQAEGALLPLENPDVVPGMGGAHTFSLSKGDSGDVNIQAQQIVLENGAQITANTLNAQGGDVMVKADTILLKKQHALGFPTAIGSTNLGAGQAGQVDIRARQMILQDGGVVTTTTFLSGRANQLRVIVDETLRISGAGEQPMIALGLPALPYPSNISSASANTGANSGQASDIYVQAKDLLLEDGGTIASLTYGGGEAGSATVVADTIRMTGWVNNGLLYRSGINNASSSPLPYAGQAGHVAVSARHIHISNGAAINTSAFSAGGGNINIEVSEQLQIADQGRITTSVQSGAGDGGNIQIENSQFTVLNQGFIVAQADAGQGGNIQLASENVLSSTDSVISASSRLGLDGNVNVESPDIEFSSNVLSVNNEFTIPAVTERCTPAALRPSSRFVWQPRQAVTPAEDDLSAVEPRFSSVQ